MDKTTLTRDVVRALKQVYDPEIPVNIYDLGLIYDMTIDDDHKVHIKMTLTAPNCPMSDTLVEDVHTAVADTPGVTDVAIEITFDPPWDKSRMSGQQYGEQAAQPQHRRIASGHSAGSLALFRYP